MQNRPFCTPGNADEEINMLHEKSQALAEFNKAGRFGGVRPSIIIMLHEKSRPKPAFLWSIGGSNP